MSYTPDGQMQSVLNIRIGAWFVKPYVWKTGVPLAPVDLTGWVGDCEFRATAGDATVLLTASTTNNKLALGADGSIVLTLEDEDTVLLENYKKGVFDILLTETSTGFKRNLIGGVFNTFPRVTKIL